VLRAIPSFPERKRLSNSIGEGRNRDLEAGRAQLSDVAIGQQAAHASAGLLRDVPAADRCGSRRLTGA
jgi:hypothetical protein